MFNEKMFNVSVALNRTLNLFKWVQIIATISEDGIVSEIIPNARIMDIVRVDYLTGEPLLAAMMRQYMIHGEVYVMKLKTHRAIANNLKEFHYRDGAIAALYVPSGNNINVFDYKPLLPKQKILTPFGIHEPEAYFVIKDETPISNSSMFDSLSSDLFNLEEITGIPYDLINHYHDLSSGEYEEAVRKVVERIVKPKCELFTAALNKELGLPENIALANRVEIDVDWVKAWKSE